MRIALILGGPSKERGISLNSARSVADHLDGQGVELAELVYVDSGCRPFSISRSLLYSNTPSDFDFKLSRISAPLTPDQLADRLRAVEIVFPAIHGSFGEDGQLQRLLEELGVPFVGSSSAACLDAYDKHRSALRLGELGLPAIETHLIGAGDGDAAMAAAAALVPRAGAVVVKPAHGGSSLDVYVETDPEAAAARIVETRDGGPFVLQPRLEGTEFTVVVLEGPGGPVALPPVEIELLEHRVEEPFLTYRHKYLATGDARYHCPPRFAPGTTERIRALAEAVFGGFGLSDFARIDGWLLPGGALVVSDINPISGMEQNSFLFMQAAAAGLSHADALFFVLRRACARHGIPGPVRAARSTASRAPIPVLFGGSTAERQVSVLSGTNVWLKLRGSERYEPIPFLLRPDGSRELWRVPYAGALRHTAEEIDQYCVASANGPSDAVEALVADVVQRLALEQGDRSAAGERAEAVTLADLLARSERIFIALHGGLGENGELQRLCEQAGVDFNGSGSEASALCMDKYATGARIAALGDGIHTARRILVPTPGTTRSADGLWKEAVAEVGARAFVVKPADDGCSAGVVPLTGERELETYLAALIAGETRIAGEQFRRLAPDQLVELPTPRPEQLILEAFVETDDVRVVDDPGADGHGGAHLEWGPSDTGWLEVTVGVLGEQGRMRALSPSVTIARRGVLSLEEKFMGGTGVNLTPPPSPPLGRVAPEAIARVRERIAETAQALGMRGYGRIDAFMHRETGEIIVIEANSLPGLTPSTVLYHQGLAEDPPLFPRRFLERIVDLSTH
jgi:D-alanine--D-alanine ligase